MPFITIGTKIDDLAENIANPPPNRPIARGVGNFGRQVCDSIAARPDLYAPTILQSPLKAICQPYWDNSGTDGPEEETTFPTGKCPVQYFFTWSTSGFPESNQTNSSVVGPMSTPVRTPGFNARWTATNGFGETLVFGRDSNIAPAEFDGWLRVDGQPDDCGDPETVFVPGTNPPPDPGPLPPGTGPTFDIRGNPVLILPPTFEFSPGVNLEFSPGEVNIGGGAGGGGPAQPPIGAAPTDGAGSGGGGGENDFGDAPEGERWAGCCVTITTAPASAGSIPQAEPQSIYPRTIGNVRLKFAAGAGATEYDTPLTNRQKTTCVWEPLRGLNPTGVRVNLLPGYSYTYTPYSVPEEN